MPIYEYRCDSCGFQKEYIQRMNDPLLTDCPECKKATFSKMVTAAGFQLKGGGWYATDFKSGGSNTNASATAAAKKPVEKQPDTTGKSESSTADKPKVEPGASSVSAASATSSASSTPAPSAAPASSGNT
ncbi:MAG TPA: zinc ribbon domain-containing protein [Burkholderiales bacterium]|nr:zinc ribbon domain-containing protein [Burkholderiales bacterium]